MTNYLKEAERRWPNCRVIGEGRYAVYSRDGRIVYLAVTESQQRLIALGIDNPVKADLEPCPVPDRCPDRFYERERS